MRVLRREHRVVQQRQPFGQRERVTGVTRFVDDRLQLGELAGAVVRGLGRQAAPATVVAGPDVRTRVRPTHRAPSARNFARSSVTRSSCNHKPPAPIAASARTTARPASSATWAASKNCSRAAAESADVECRLGEREQVVRPRFVRGRLLRSRHAWCTAEVADRFGARAISWHGGPRRRHASTGETEARSGNRPGSRRRTCCEGGYRSEDE